MTIQSIARACAAVTIAFSSHATAGKLMLSNGEFRHQAVSFEALEPETDEGARHLALRIRLAAYAVCGGLSGEARADGAVSTCVARTVDSAARQLGAPRVAAALGVGTLR